MDRKAWRKQQREKDIADAHENDMVTKEILALVGLVILAGIGLVSLLQSLF